MGSVLHHQTQARRFLSLARSDHNSGKYDRAANALARAASHAATSALFHCALLRRPTRRKLTNTLFMLADAGRSPTEGCASSAASTGYPTNWLQQIPANGSVCPVAPATVSRR